jgi:hypothetical protein
MNSNFEQMSLNAAKPEVSFPKRKAPEVIHEDDREHHVD